MKAPRYATYRPRLAEAGPAIERFFASGVSELGDKLGPVLWQLPPYKRFDEADLAAFLELLPRRLNGRPMRHALEPRHAASSSRGSWHCFAGPASPWRSPTRMFTRRSPT